MIVARSKQILGGELKGWENCCRDGAVTVTGCKMDDSGGVGGG
jgi:hypothetical protein